MFPFIVGFLFPFPVFCLCVFLCFLLSFYFFLSFYCFYFFLDLPSVAWFSLHFRFLFLPPSPLTPFPYLSLLSFPLWVFLLSPLVPLSRLFCSLSATLVFPFLPFSPFPQFLSSSFVSVSFPVPSSPLLADSSSCWSDLSPICCVPLRCVSLSSFSPVSLLFLFLCLVCFFSESSSLVPVLVSSTSSSSPFLFPSHLPFCFLGFVLFLCLAPSASLSRFPSVSSSDVSSFGLVAFRPPPGFPPLPLHLVFDPLPLLVLLRFTLTLLSLFLPPMVFFGSSSGLSLLFGSLTCIYFLIFFLFPFSPLLLWFSFPL